MKAGPRLALCVFSMAAVVAFLLPGQVVATDNVDYLGTFDPQYFAELLDCEYRDDTLFIAGVSGFTIVDVFNRSSPTMIGRYVPPGDPYDRFYHIAVAESVAYGFGRDDGISIIEFGIPSNPNRIGLVNFTSVSFEDGRIYNGRLYVTAHSREYTYLRLQAGVFWNTSANSQTRRKTTPHW